MITTEQLQQDILNDPALEQQFAACTSLEQAVALALALAAERGYTLDAREVARSLAAPPLTPLTDEELVEIGGGNGYSNIEEPDVMANNLQTATVTSLTARRRSVRK
jgi:hypothetical protein